ncbi:MAG: permease-like cell division protein FtsX [Bacteroidales bacterium]|nr:permease-like cell division protein FtsX [Bacteroidales bacterium]
MVLFVFGLLLFVGYQSYRTTHDIQERITFKVDLTADISDSLALALQKEVEQYDYVKHVDYISKEEAARIFASDLGEDFVSFIGYNPLYPSLMVNFKSTILPDRDQQLLQQFTRTVGQKTGVTGVTYQENVVTELTDTFYKLFWFLVVFLVLHLFIAIVLINTTIKIAIFARQDTIRTMRMVGARNSFIARPFLWRSVVYGFIGALLALVLTVGVVGAFDSRFGLHLLQVDQWLTYSLMAAGIVVVGVLIAWCATAAAVRRQLRNSSNE